MTVIAASSGPGFLFIIVIGFLLIWLIVVRPQKKRQVQQKQMLEELNVGDEVLTAGGIYGTVSALDENEVTVEIAPNTEVRVARRAIAGVTREPEDDEPEDEEPESDPDDAEDPEETLARLQAADDPNGANAGPEPSDEVKRG
ncbi:MAG: preprotein translocase subunit YajC [Gaiellaceae bacterium]